MRVVIMLVKLVCLALYLVAAFVGLPLLIVGTGLLIMHWLGDAGWVAIVIAPICLAEFILGLSFFLWEKNPIPDWLLR